MTQETEITPESTWFIFFVTWSADSITFYCSSATIPQSIQAPMLRQCVGKYSRSCHRCSRQLVSDSEPSSKLAELGELNSCTVGAGVVICSSKANSWECDEWQMHTTAWRQRLAGYQLGQRVFLHVDGVSECGGSQWAVNVSAPSGSGHRFDLQHERTL